MAQTVFYIFAVAAVLGAAMCILQRNPVASALWLMSTMFSLACIYVLLNAQLIGILQILVYVGAILVLFLFVLMLLNLGHEAGDVRGAPGVATTIVIVGLLLAELVGLVRYTPERLVADIMPGAPAGVPAAALFPAGAATQQAVEAQGVVGALAEPLFRAYLVPFEITSLLLLVAAVGAVVLAKRRI